MLENLGMILKNFVVTNWTISENFVGKIVNGFLKNFLVGTILNSSEILVGKLGMGFEKILVGKSGRGWLGKILFRNF